MDDRLRIGEERRLIFQNYANGVPVETIMEVYRRSQAEVEKDVEFVVKKLREYRFRRQLPPLDCSDERMIRFNRRPLLETLNKLGPEYLSSELILPKIGVQQLDSPAIVREAAQHVRARVRG